MKIQGDINSKSVVGSSNILTTTNQNIDINFNFPKNETKSLDNQSLSQSIGANFSKPNKYPEINFIKIKEDGSIDFSQFDNIDNEKVRFLELSDKVVVEYNDGNNIRKYVEINPETHILECLFEYNNNTSGNKKVTYYDNGNKKYSELVTEEMVSLKNSNDDFIPKDTRLNLTVYDNNEPIIEINQNNEVKDYRASNIANAIKSNNTEQLQTYISKYLKPNDQKTTSLVMEKYHEITGQELLLDIQNSNSISQKEKEAIIKNTIGDFCNKSGLPKFNETRNSKVENKNYTGDEYEINYLGPIINIKNLRTNNQSKLDINKILKTGATKYDIKEFMRNIYNAPGEVLEDISKELNSIELLDPKSKEFVSENRVAGEALNDNIVITRNTLKTIVHELGHCIDCDENENMKSMNPNNEFNKIYTEELANYNKEHSSFDENKKHQSQSLKDWFLLRSNYVSKNAGEGFAEMYAYLMLGENKSSSVIEKYFKKSLQVAKKQIEETRKLEDRKSNTTQNLEYDNIVNEFNMKYQGTKTYY